MTSTLSLRGYDLSSVTVYEDHKSTSSLVPKGKSTSERTKHINVCYHFIKDKIDMGAKSKRKNNDQKYLRSKINSCIFNLIR